MQLVPVDQRHGDTGPSGAPRAADAVHVGLLVVGALVVDDVGDVVDVDSSGGDIGGDEYVDAPLAEGSQGLLARDLSEVSVNGADGEPALSEVIGDLLGCALGPGENHCGAATLGLKDAGDELGLVEGVRAVHVLGGALVDRRIVGVLGADVRRLGQECAGQGHDRSGHRGREEHGLTGIRQRAHDSFDVGEESQVEHLVGLVENQDLHLAQDQVALAGEVEQTPGSTHHDVDADLQLADLMLERPAAEDREQADGPVLPIRGVDVQALGRDLEVVGHLDAQLARGHDDQRAGSSV